MNSLQQKKGPHKTLYDQLGFTPVKGVGAFASIAFSIKQVGKQRQEHPQVLELVLWLGSSGAPVRRNQFAGFERGGRRCMWRKKQ